MSVLCKNQVVFLLLTSDRDVYPEGARPSSGLRQPTVPNTLLSSPLICESVNTRRISNTPATNRADNCPTYVNWNTNDWFFGTDSQLALIRYNVGLTRSNPGCDFNPNTSLPQCGDLVGGQPDRDDAALQEVALRPTRATGYSAATENSLYRQRRHSN